MISQKGEDLYLYIYGVLSAYVYGTKVYIVGHSVGVLTFGIAQISRLRVLGMVQVELRT